MTGRITTDIDVHDGCDVSVRSWTGVSVTGITIELGDVYRSGGSVARIVFYSTGGREAAASLRDQLAVVLAALDEVGA